ELEDLKICEEDDEWLNSLPASELKKYAGKYIAVKNKKILAASESLKDIYEQRDKLNVGIVTIRWMEDADVVIY
ncbi:MAG: DUF5678 domain-containing protein, partial [Methanosarcinales archaeon]